jgi:N utilization substance protein B
MASRRKSRELALQMLYQWEVGKHSPDQVLATFIATEKKDGPAETLARRLFEGTVEDISPIDQLLREHAQHWRLERMAAIDRNVLRLALFELRHQSETPAAVVINEALEIARRFSGEDSAAFVNGVLDAIRKTLSATVVAAEPASSVPPDQAVAPKKRRQRSKRV